MNNNGRLPVDWPYPVNDQNSSKVLFKGKHTYDRTSVGVRESFRAKPPHTWILSKGFRGVQTGDRLWIYSGGAEQFITALTHAVSQPRPVGGDWYVDLEPDWPVTDYLEHRPLSRFLFRQIPQSVVRANPVTVAYLEAHLLAAQTYSA